MKRVIYPVVAVIFIAIYSIISCSYAQEATENNNKEKILYQDAVKEIELPVQIPAGNCNPETITNDGIDNDGDGVVDEGSNLGTCMIIIYTNDDNPDDDWALRVDGKFQGRYQAGDGKARFWDLMLPEGNHKVVVEAESNRDTSGNYSIMFNNCKAIKGPEQDPFNDSEQTLFEWDVVVP